MNRIYPLQIGCRGCEDFEKHCLLSNKLYTDNKLLVDRVLVPHCFLMFSTTNEIDENE
jgi:hypothetical protein